MSANDPNLTQIHDKLRAGVKDWDTYEQAEAKIGQMRAADAQIAAANTGGAGFEWVFALFGTRYGRHFLAGVMLSVLTAWAVFHLWIVAPSPTGFTIPTKTLGSNWDSHFRRSLQNAGIRGNALDRCRRRLNFDPPCRLNFDPGMEAGIVDASCV